MKAAAALMALGRRISRYSEELGAWSKLSVTMIESGNTVNMYPSEGHLVIDRRLVPGETTAEGHRQIREVLDGLRRAHPQADYSYEYEVLGEYPCLVVDENEPIVRMCLEAYREVTGKGTAVYRRRRLGRVGHCGKGGPAHAEFRRGRRRGGIYPRE